MGQPYRLPTRQLAQGKASVLKQMPGWHASGEVPQTVRIKTGNLGASYAAAIECNGLQHVTATTGSGYPRFARIRREQQHHFALDGKKILLRA
jgi:hypothetical protein